LVPQSGPPVITAPSEFLVITGGPVLKARISLVRDRNSGESVGIAAVQIRRLVPAFDHDEHARWMLRAKVGDVRCINCPGSHMQVALLVAV